MNLFQRAQRVQTLCQEHKDSKSAELLDTVVHPPDLNICSDTKTKKSPPSGVWSEVGGTYIGDLAVTFLYFGATDHFLNNGKASYDLGFKGLCGPVLVFRSTSATGDQIHLTSEEYTTALYKTLKKDPQKCSAVKVLTSQERRNQRRHLLQSLQNSSSSSDNKLYHLYRDGDCEVIYCDLSYCSNYAIAISETLNVTDNFFLCGTPTSKVAPLFHELFRISKFLLIFLSC
jgi:hypothetical protein